MQSVQNMGSVASPCIQLLVLLAMLDGITSQHMDTTRVTANASAHLQRVSGVAGVMTCPRLFDLLCHARKAPCDPARQLYVLGRMPYLRAYFLWESPF